MTAVEEATVLGRAEGPRGEVLLRRRDRPGGAVHELIVNGVFAMDSAETSSERRLATFAAVGGGRAPRVLVGGLGLGYTAAAVLDDPAVGATLVDVVELERHLVSWARAGLTPVLSRVAGDPRTRLHVADVSAVLRGASDPAGPWDAVLLDVDNGPDFLIHGTNAGLYARPTLEATHARLTAGGVLAIWCQGPAPALLETLGLIGPAREHCYAVEREGRRFSYVVYTLAREATGAEVASSAVPGLGNNDLHG
jgi:spermidine synthase